MNKVILIGNLGHDPEAKEVGGKPVVNFRLATNERWRDRDGERQESTEWHSCALWGAQVEHFVRLVGKGTKVAIEGRLHHREDEKDGVKRTFTTVVVQRWELLAGARQEGAAEGGGEGGGEGDEVAEEAA